MKLTLCWSRAIVAGLFVLLYCIQASVVLADARDWIYGTPDVIKRAIKGININAFDIKGKTPLMYAAEFNTPEAVHVILTSAYPKADPNITTVNGVTALMFAVRNTEHSKEIITQLLDAGAKIDATDSNGRTALMRAAKDKEENRGKAIIMLLNRQANASSKDNTGKTVLEYADENSKLWNTYALDLLRKCSDPSQPCSRETDPPPPPPGNGNSTGGALEPQKPSSSNTGLWDIWTIIVGLATIISAVIAYIQLIGRKNKAK
jgi:hypothetical protein